MFHGRKFKYLHRENLWDSSSDEDEREDTPTPVQREPQPEPKQSKRRATAAITTTTAVAAAAAAVTATVANLTEDEEENEEIDENPSNVAMIEVSNSSGSNAPMNISSGTPATATQLEEPNLRPRKSEESVVAKLPYQPRTITDESRRYSILPAFPTSYYEARPVLLLANVPRNKLDKEQLARRRPGLYPTVYLLNPVTHDITSYFHVYYQAFISDLIFQHNISESIIDFNLYRMMECFRIVADEFIQRHKYKSDTFDLNDKQKKYALEFYLQIDVDLFFMKTCSYRNAQPRNPQEGVFCNEEPDVRYGLSPCNNCPLCVPPYDIARRQQPTIRFGPSQKYRFINGYQTILNCPADCNSRNIIYVMSCPCGEYEYIGETSQRVGDRLWYHRQHYNRIIHEFLIGPENVRMSQTNEKDRETLIKDRMLLYRHAARCPWTMQIFMNFNPAYWCFVPMLFNDAERENRCFILPSSLVLLDSYNPTSIGSKDRRLISGTTEARGDEFVRSCMRRIPSVPTGYTFSIRQRAEQFQYFKNKLDIKTKQNEYADLFNVAIIAVLPLDASEALRRFVEALFITHTEAKLNTSGQILRDQTNEDEVNDGNPIDLRPEGGQTQDRGIWCRNLVR